MGCYINPQDQTKEEWLKKHAIVTPEPCAITQTHIPLCWVDNRHFTALAVGYHPLEVSEMIEGMAGRKHKWYRASREEVRKVSPLENYERHDPPSDYPEEGA